MAIEHATQRLFHTEFGCMIISALFGIGLAFIFSNVCKGNSCLIVNAPDINDIKGKVFQIQDECYIYTPQVASCDLIASAPSPTSLYQHIYSNKQ